MSETNMSVSKEAIERELFNLQKNFIKELQEQNRLLLEVLKRADIFITNGIELGYIKMPEMKTDSAHKTPGIIKDALRYKS